MGYASFARKAPLLVLAGAVSLTAACGEQARGTRQEDAAAAPRATNEPAQERGIHRNAYYGAVHVLTSYSFDDAYAWARGRSIPEGAGGPMAQLRSPLDFYVLSDPAVSRSTWQGVVAAADAAYEPGVFTTFPAFEWTSSPTVSNPHRVVIFRDSENVPDLPVSSHASERPEDLWTWMERQREAGATLTAIPHNGDASDRQIPALVNPDAQNRIETNPHHEFSSTGLAGVWAEENTRESIYDAIQRRETFGTSGPKIRVRFFGGWDFSSVDVSSTAWMHQAYEHGAPMGGTLETGPNGRPPVFMAWAMKDPESGNLDRLQIVKGWVDSDGNRHEKVFEVDWSGEREPGDDGRLPPVGNTVDAATATYTNDIGSAELAGFWVDPDFDPRQNAFYYVRVLEIPTPRWSTYEAVALGVEPPEGVPASIQEQAWTSPISYEP